jgi:hypothetical protein
MLQFDSVLKSLSMAASAISIAILIHSSKTICHLAMQSCFLLSIGTDLMGPMLSNFYMVMA